MLDLIIFCILMVILLALFFYAIHVCLYTELKKLDRFIVKLWLANKFFWEESEKYVGGWKSIHFWKAPIAWCKFMHYEVRDGKNNRF